MANPLLNVPWDACLLEPHADRLVDRFARGRLGMVPPVVRYFGVRPWVARAFVSWSYEHRLLLELDLDLADLLALVVSQDNSCRFCYAATRGLLRIRGVDEARIHALEQRLATADLEPRAAAAIDFARRLSRAAPLPDRKARESLVAAGFSLQEIREIAFVVAYIAFANRLATLIAIPFREIEHMPDRLGMRLARPLLARWLERFRGHGRPEPGYAAPPDGPYRSVVEAFAPSPVAPAIAAGLAELLESDALPGRCKALMFAVVAHALGCDVSAAEAQQMLTAIDSGIDVETLGTLLTHLDAPDLDPLAARLVAFARETVWYTPQRLQRTARTLRDALPREQFVEAVGVASVANALCRLAAVVVEPA